MKPGEGFDYQISAACSGLTEGCISAKTVDVIPEGIIITVPPSQPPLYTVSYVPATRTLTVTYTDKLASPPNPAGSLGILAGSTRTITIHAEVDPKTTLPDGSTVTNTANATADNTDPATDSADITVAVPRTVTPTATKSFSETSLIAQSGAGTIATLGIRNDSSTSADIDSLRVADTSKNTWDDFDLASLGPVQQMPAGGDQVAVSTARSTATTSMATPATSPSPMRARRASPSCPSGPAAPSANPTTGAPPRSRPATPMATTRKSARSSTASPRSPTPTTPPS